MKDVNLNQIAEVELTATGEIILEFSEHVSADHHPMNSEGKRTFRLWQLMAIFGPGLHMGGQIPFENNSFSIKESS